MTALTTTMLNLASTMLGQTAPPAATRPSDGSGGIWFPDQASTVAPGVDLVFDIITWISIFFFVLVVVVMVWFVMKYHTGRAPKATSDVTHNTPLELTWTIIPLILVIAIFYVGLEGYLNLRHAPLGAYEVRVTAQKWSWTFSHPNGTIESNILRVPLGRPVKLIMRSEDVLHALYIPSFRVKQDVVPGRFTTLWFEATKEGDFDLYCAEYCGKDHSLMRARVIVAPEDVFKAQLDAEGRRHMEKSDAELAAYAMEKLYSRCSSCHSLDGKRGTGPSWRETHSLWGKERVFTDGSKAVVDENYIRESMLNPGAHIVVDFTNAMPTVKGQLDDRQIFAMILAIRNLDAFDNTGKPIAGKEINATAPPAFPGSSPEGPPKLLGGSTTQPATPATTPSATTTTAPSPSGN
jgi:cytochrome c oxidase subunit II